MRLLQRTFPPCRNLWPREHQKEWWGLCISDHSVGSSPITSRGNSLKTCKIGPSALCTNLWFNHVLPGESLPFHCFKFSSCWLTWRLSSSYTGILSHTHAPCQKRLYRPVSHVPFQLSLFQAEQPVSIYVIPCTEAVPKLSSCFYAHWASSAVSSSMPCH